MKEDQTRLITARLKHLRFMMESGDMPIFRHRSDMFLFAMEAHNIARGLSSRYYRLQEDLDIRFFVHFDFDYWLLEIQKWVEQLSGDAYRVEGDNFFAEGRAKRLTIVVDRLFDYHTDRLPADSAEGSMPLPDDEILEPFKAIMDMNSVDLVASFRNALQEVHDYLLKLAMMPVEWSDECRKNALQIYLDDSMQKAKVQTELANYKYYCCMQGGDSIKSQFYYLRQRLYELGDNGALSHFDLSITEHAELLTKLGSLFGKDEINFAEDRFCSSERPVADEEQFARLLYFIQFDDASGFPILDKVRVSNYLIRKDVVFDETQEENLQALFALIGAMKEYLDPILEKRLNGSRHGVKVQERIDSVMGIVKMYNSKISSLLDRNRKVEEIDAFFESLFSPEWKEQYGDGLDELLSLFEKGRDAIKLESYIHMLREANNTLGFFINQTALGKKIYSCLSGETVVEDANEETVNSYYSKVDYKKTSKWENAIKLVEAVEKKYKQI